MSEVAVVDCRRLEVQELEVRKLIRLATLAVTVAALAACGGGGGGGDEDDGPSIEDELSAPQSPPSAATGDLTLLNYQTEALTLSRLILNSGEAGQSLESGSAASADGSSATVLRAVGRATSRLIEKNAGREQALDLHQESDSCSGGGTVEVTVYYQSDRAVSVGDKATLIFKNCIEDGVTLTGGYSVRFTRYDNEHSYAARVAFVNFSDQTTTFRGWADLETRGQGFSATLSYYGLVTTVNGQTSQWFHTVGFMPGGMWLNMNGYVRLGTAIYRLQQIESFYNVMPGYPREGVLRVFDASGDYIDIRALDTRFEYALHLNGSSTPAEDAVEGPLYGDIE